MVLIYNFQLTCNNDCKLSLIDNGGIEETSIVELFGNIEITYVELFVDKVLDLLLLNFSNF